MNDQRMLRGIELRYVLTRQLFINGPASIPELLGQLRQQGFGVGSPAPKQVSDALRWERRLGRVCRLGWGVYGPGDMPRGTEHRIHQRFMALRAEAKSLRGGHIGTSFLE